jgi:hypothetical protein
MKRKREGKAARPVEAKAGQLVPGLGPDANLSQIQLRSRPQPGVTTAHLAGTFLVAGLLPNAKVARDWSCSQFGDPATSIDLTTTYDSVVEAAERVNRGDLSNVEAILAAQVITLNAMFVDLARRAHVTQALEYEGHYLKLAFKAQSQCRATAESLAVLKNPPAFARQANIAGQQVVNNGTITQASRAREIESAPKELLEAHGERLDAGETSQRRRRRSGAGARGSTPPGQGPPRVRPAPRGTRGRAGIGR